ncbi:hypothetical protein EPA93_12045 [Ktedonosporobacter rubrisoli]|uniref:DUF4097 domain-containing protein n=1 Tax=Ktedonosporobacter rubrisoli TaxID=2509675 RepID=A0A4P6JN57_KTERU|nr:DUF4097 family beta strand repeat-containing protein [Ktedonosporobacter rubrisoli]QBD76694.1 hypothetical protein EPA93_12045 [Ktedonosporobacter rubrisoli]
MMSNQESMFTPPEQSGQQQERMHNTDPREQAGSAQQHYYEPQPSVNPYAEDYHGQYQESQAYEDGYRGYSGPYTQHEQGEKLRPKQPAFQGQRRTWLIILIVFVLVVSGGMGSLLSALAGMLSSIVGIVIVIAVIAAVSTRPVPLPTRTFDVSEQPVLRIHNDAGNVRIWRGQAEKIEVRGTKYVSRLFGENATTPLEYTQVDNGLNVDVKHWSSNSLFNVFSVTLDVYVPESCTVQIDSNAGSLNISGIKGQVRARTNAGTVMVEQAVLAPGSELKTNAGTITMREATLGERTDVHTNAGTIHAERTLLQGRVTLLTDAGTIHFDGTLDPRGNYRMKTSAGTIHVVLPSNSSFILNARTSMGSVTNEFGGTAVGAEPQAQLDLSSDLGTIHVQRR